MRPVYFGLFLGLIALLMQGCVTASPERSPAAQPQKSALMQYLFGLQLLRGEQNDRDAGLAARQIRAAADSGLSAAQATLGLLYEHGRGLPQDYQAALRNYRLAADQGNAVGQRQLGRLYVLGKGIAKDPEQGRRWIEHAAQQGDAAAEARINSAKPLMPLPKR